MGHTRDPLNLYTPYKTNNGPNNRNVMITHASHSVQFIKLFL